MQRARLREEVRTKTMLYHHLLASWALSSKGCRRAVCEVGGTSLGSSRKKKTREENKGVGNASLPLGLLFLSSRDTVRMIGSLASPLPQTAVI